MMIHVITSSGQSYNQFPNVYRIKTPVPLDKKGRSFQSPSISPNWHPINPLVRSPIPFLEPSVLREKYQQRVIPVSSISHISLSPIYYKNSQNAGLKGRPAQLPYEDHVVRIMNTYLVAQPIVQRRVARLKAPLIVKSEKNFQVSPYDGLVSFQAREATWSKHLRKERTALKSTDLVERKTKNRKNPCNPGTWMGLCQKFGMIEGFFIRFRLEWGLQWCIRVIPSDCSSNSPTPNGVWGSPVRVSFTPRDVVREELQGVV